MFPSERALVNFAASSLIRATQRCNNYKFVACFSSISDGNKFQGGTTRPGSEGYGGSGVSNAENAAAEGLHGGGHGGARGDFGRNKVLGGTTRPGSEGYGASGVSNAGNTAAEGLHGGRHDGVEDLGRGSKVFDSGERRRGNTEDAARETAGYVADIAKAGVVGAMETGLKLGEMAKQTMDGMWDATKKTTETVRDSVAEGGSDNLNNTNNHHNRIDDINDVNNNSYESDQSKQASDRHVEDLRRLARGYDLKDH